MRCLQMKKVFPLFFCIYILFLSVFASCCFVSNKIEICIGVKEKTVYTCKINSRVVALKKKEETLIANPD
jgi:hypothetical protein